MKEGPITPVIGPSAFPEGLSQRLGYPRAVRSTHIFPQPFSTLV